MESETGKPIEEIAETSSVIAKEIVSLKATSSSKSVSQSSKISTTMTTIESDEGAISDMGLEKDLSGLNLIEKSSNAIMPADSEIWSSDLVKSESLSKQVSSSVQQQSSVSFSSSTRTVVASSKEVVASSSSRSVKTISEVEVVEE